MELELFQNLQLLNW